MSGGDTPGLKVEQIFFFARRYIKTGTVSGFPIWSGWGWGFTDLQCNCLLEKKCHFERIGSHSGCGMGSRGFLFAYKSALAKVDTSKCEITITFSKYVACYLKYFNISCMTKLPMTNHYRSLKVISYQITETEITFLTQWLRFTKLYVSKLLVCITIICSVNVIV